MSELICYLLLFIPVIIMYFIILPEWNDLSTTDEGKFLLAMCLPLAHFMLIVWLFVYIKDFILNHTVRKGEIRDMMEKNVKTDLQILLKNYNNF